jgi:NaMN:DMB phosphoribosyltransferase
MMALHLVDDAVAIRDEMATFAQAGVTENEQAGQPATETTTGQRAL